MSNANKFLAHPKARTVGEGRERYCVLALSSPREGHELARQWARSGQAGHAWSGENSRWLGLAGQSRDNFDQSGIANEPLRLTREANARLPEKFTRMDKPVASITGGYWDTPSVLQNLPLSARTRKRAKLAPKQIKLAFCMSAGITSESMAPLTAKIAAAIHAYTLAGGAVTLTVAHLADVHKSTAGYKGLMVEMKTNAADLNSLAAVLSPVYLRCVVGPLGTAFSDYDSDSLTVPRVCPVKDYLYIGGVLTKAIEAANTVVKQLEIQ